MKTLKYKLLSYVDAWLNLSGMDQLATLLTLPLVVVLYPFRLFIELVVRSLLVWEQISEKTRKPVHKGYRRK